MAVEKLSPYALDHGLVATDEILEWHRRALHHMLVADQASADYERRKPGIEQHHKKQLLKNHGSVEESMFRKAMGDSWVLNDLLKKHAWHRDEANRLNTAILTQHALREMLTKENEINAK